MYSKYYNARGTYDFSNVPRHVEFANEYCMFKQNIIKHANIYV